VSSFAGLGLTLLCLLGFTLGYWAAHDKPPERRVLTGILVGLAVLITPTVIGVIGR
jgi:ABC-type molybdate transport system permease subunit